MHDVTTLVAAEYAFARRSWQSNTRDAFVEWLADQAIVFSGGPVRGRERIAAGPVRPELLTWFPVRAEASACGTLGFTTGPYEVRAERPFGRVLSCGTYVSVWRVIDGEWRVVVDGGITAQLGTAGRPARSSWWGAAFGGGAGVLGTPQASQGLEASSRAISLLAVEDELQRHVGVGDAGAYQDLVAQDIAVLHQGAGTATGFGDASVLLSGSPLLGRGWRVVEAGVSESGDLGFTVGAGAAGTTGNPSCVHIWRAKLDGSWELALELIPRQ